MANATNSRPCSISPDQAELHINSMLDSADPMRAQSLSKLQRTREVKLKAQEREKLRLTEKYGDNHPRVMALQAKVEQNKVYVRTLNVEAKRAQTETPIAESNSWIVYGRVLNNQYKPVSGMKVALYDSSGCPIQSCGREITDNNGYFKLAIKDLPDDTTGGAAQDGPDKAYVYVLDSNGVIVHEDKTALPIVAGEVRYVEIVLGKDDGGLGKPVLGRRVSEDISRPTQTATRYLGNSNTRELHDLKNQKPACQIDEIKADHRVNFKTQREAVAQGYDFCAYCFGKEKSKR